MITLYGFKGSGSAAIEVALEHCGAAYNVVRAASWEKDSAVAELERVNPLKQIPTIVFDDGTVMSESAAILIELALRYPASKLLPSEPALRARALRGLVYIPANCYAAVSVSDFPERWTTPFDEATSERVRAGARKELHRLWDVFSDLFCATSKANFLVADEPCALDLLAAVVSKWSGTRKHLQSSRPDFLAMLHRIEAHPNVAPVFARHWP
ncbi:MAG: glutathione S-transferase family protein [Casimicrobium sp.]